MQIQSTSKKITLQIKFLTKIILGFVPLATTACADLGTQSRVNPISTVSYQPSPTENCPMVAGLYERDRKHSINLSCFTFPEKDVTLTDAVDAKTTVRANGNAYALATISQTARNRLTSILIKHSDDICARELGQLTADEATVNTALSVANSGFSIASTIVGGDLAKSILSGTAAFAGASRDHVNVHVYRNAVAQSISKVIWAKRNELRTALQTKYSSGTANWTIDDAIRSVNEYHQQCSLSKGLDLLAAAATNSGEFAAAKAAKLRQSCENRFERQIFQLEAAAARATGDSKSALSERANAMRVAQSKIGTGEADSPECADAAGDQTEAAIGP